MADEHRRPVVAHADDGVATIGCRGERPSAPLSYGSIPAPGVVVVVDEQAKAGAGRAWAKSSIGTSPLELPPASSGRRPMRLQIRTGFSRPVVHEVENDVA